MNHDYEQLLGELSVQCRSQAEAKQAAAAERQEDADKLAELEDRLLAQQADLLNTARKLRLGAPRLLPRPSESADLPADFATCLRQADRLVAAAESAAQRAWNRATVPAFLPYQRPRVRNLAVYGIAGLAGAAVQLLALTAQGLRDGAWIVALAPLAAFVAGYVAVGQARQPRLKPERLRKTLRRTPRVKLSRDVKPGLAVCMAFGLATVAWWLLR